MYSGVFCNKSSLIYVIRRVLRLQIHLKKPFLEAVSEKHKHRRKIRNNVFRKPYPEFARLALFYSPERLFIHNVPAIENLFHRASPL